MQSTDTSLLATFIGLCGRLWDRAFGWQYRCPRCSSDLEALCRSTPDGFSAEEVIYACQQCGIEMPEAFWVLSGLND